MGWVELGLVSAFGACMGASKLTCLQSICTQTRAGLGSHTKAFVLPFILSPSEKKKLYGL
jgi:hypothetical protein